MTEGAASLGSGRAITQDERYTFNLTKRTCGWPIAWPRAQLEDGQEDFLPWLPVWHSKKLMQTGNQTQAQKSCDSGQGEQ